MMESIILQHKPISSCRSLSHQQEGELVGARVYCVLCAKLWDLVVGRSSGLGVSVTHIFNMQCLL